MCKKPRQTYFGTQLLNIIPNLFPVLTKAEFPVNTWLSATLYHSVIWRAQEIRHREPLQFRVGHHSMLNALVHTVAPCLEQVANVDYKGIGVWFNSDPFLVFHQLQTPNLILIQYGQKVTIRVWHQTVNPKSSRARRISIQSEIARVGQTILLKEPWLLTHFLRQYVG